VLINSIFASYLQDGAVSWLNIAFRLMQLPLGIFGVAVATVTLPLISRSAAQGNTGEFRGALAHALRLVMLLTIPSAIGLIIMAEPIISLIYQHGRFTAFATEQTAGALQFYAIGLVGYSIVRIASPAFYALGDSRTPVTISMAAVAVNAGANLALVRVLGYRGLALGTSIAAIFNAGALLWMLRRRLDGLEERRLSSELIRIIVASAVMGAAAWAANDALVEILPGTTFAVQCGRLLATIVSALAALAVAAHVLGIDELRRVVAVIAPRGPNPPDSTSAS